MTNEEIELLCVDFNGNPMVNNRTKILRDISKERKRQNELWGFPQTLTPMEWGSILAEETGEVCQLINNAHGTGNFTCHCDEDLYKELVHVAAVAINIAEHMEIAKGIKS